MGRPSPLPGLEWRNCHASLSTQEGAIVCQHGVASIVSRIFKFKVDWLWILCELALGMAFSQHFIYSLSSLIYSLVLKRLLWTLLAGSRRSDRTVFSSKQDANLECSSTASLEGLEGEKVAVLSFRQKTHTDTWLRNLSLDRVPYGPTRTYRAVTMPYASVVAPMGLAG